MNRIDDYFSPKIEGEEKTSREDDVPTIGNSLPFTLTDEVPSRFDDEELEW